MNLGKKILELRKERGITQNELAEKLFVSYQAVSQWENGNTNPDVSIIPNIAKVFNITIDELFSEDKEQQHEVKLKNFDENSLYIVIIKGDKLLNVLDYNEVLNNKEYEDINIDVTGDNIKAVNSHFSVTVKGDVMGSVSAGGGVNCGNIDGSVSSGDGINCGNVDGSVSAGDSINCGNVGGSISAGDGIICGNVDGSVNAESVSAQVIKGNVEAETVSAYNIYSKNIKAGLIKVEGKIFEENE